MAHSLVAFGENRQKKFHRCGIELAARAAPQFFQGVFGGAQGAPRAGAGHGGIGVHHGEEAVHRRDLLALEPPGIARAVGAFVVAQDGVRRHCEIGTGEGDAVSDFRMVAQIAVAPVRPYEFIRLRLGRAERLSVQVEERR